MFSCRWVAGISCASNGRRHWSHGSKARPRPGTCRGRSGSLILHRSVSWGTKMKLRVLLRVHFANRKNQTSKIKGYVHDSSEAPAPNQGPRSPQASGPFLFPSGATSLIVHYRASSCVHPGHVGAHLGPLFASGHRISLRASLLPRSAAQSQPELALEACIAQPARLAHEVSASSATAALCLLPLSRAPAWQAVEVGGQVEVVAHRQFWCHRSS